MRDARASLFSPGLHCKICIDFNDSPVNLRLLVSTKLHFPPIRSKFIARPRLIELLNEGLTHPLTLISAPAGFGKTTLLGEWRCSGFGRELPAAWLSLDSDDNELTQFLTYLAAALNSIDARLGESALTLLQSSQPPPVNSVLTTLINDLSTLQSPAVLILDDYHLISSEVVHQAVFMALSRAYLQSGNAPFAYSGNVPDSQPRL